MSATDKNDVLLAESLIKAMAMESEMEKEETSVDVLELLYRLLAKWKIIVCVALLLAALAGVLTTIFVMPMYSATSTIYIVNRADSVINMTDLQIGTAVARDYVKIFNVWEIHDQVIKNLDLPYTCGEMQSMVSVYNEDGTRMLDISFHCESPEEAALVANEYARVASDYIASALVTARPSVVSVARVPERPYNKSVTVKNTTIGFVVGAAVVMAFVGVQYFMDDKYKTEEDIAKFAGLVTLATVPLNEVEQTQKAKGTRKDKGARREK